MLGCDRHGVDHEFRAVVPNDFDDLKQRSAATRAEIEQSAVVLILDRHGVFHDVLNILVVDAVFTR